MSVIDGRHLHLRDAASEFASSVVALLRDAALRARLEAAARDLVVRHHDWAKVAGDLEDALLVIAQRSREAA